MSDDIDELLKDWLRGRGTTDRSSLEAATDRIAALPPRRRRRRANLAAAAAVVLALGLATFALVPRLGSVSAPPVGPVAPVPPDPAAFAGDPRLARCGATVETSLDVFEMAHARDYHKHLPAMLLAPELDTDAPAFVVVYRGRDPLAYGRGAPLPGQTVEPPASLAPGHYDACVLVGADPATAELNVYGDVDISGLTATIDEPVVSGPASTEPSPSPTPSEGTGTTLTPEPGPAWAGDPTAALECADPLRAGLAPLRDASFAAIDPDDDRLLRFYLQSVRSAGDPFPSAGWVEGGRTPTAHLFVVEAQGHAKAALVISARPPVATIGSSVEWVVSAVAACDPSEFDPSTPTGRDPIGIWTDAAGARVPSGTLVGTADCYEGTQVRFRDRLYVRIPGGGVDPSQLETTWANKVAIPSTARSTPYRSGELRLFVAADGRAIYIGANGRGERLPHVIGDQVVRVDCN